jgi:hypothetical protein
MDIISTQHTHFCNTYLLNMSFYRPIFCTIQHNRSNHVLYNLSFSFYGTFLSYRTPDAWHNSILKVSFLGTIWPFKLASPSSYVVVPKSHLIYLVLVIMSESNLFGSAFFWPAFLRIWMWRESGCEKNLNIVRIRCGGRWSCPKGSWSRKRWIPTIVMTRPILCLYWFWTIYTKMILIEAGRKGGAFDSSQQLLVARSWKKPKQTWQLSFGL